MSQFTSIIAQIAAMLSITPLDVYVFFTAFVCAMIIAACRLTRIYGAFFGVVLGMGIFVLFSTILSPEFQTPETLSLISQTFAKILIGSSVYLIFILAFLVPINGGMIISLPRTVIGSIIQTLVLSVVLVIFILAVAIGLIEKTYIFVHTDSAFALLQKTATYADVRGSMLFQYVRAHLPTIIILSIGYIIYKLLLADIIGAMVVSIIANMKKRKAISDAQIQHRHIEDGLSEHTEHIEEEEHEHDDHGHGGHSGHGHGHGH